MKNKKIIFFAIVLLGIAVFFWVKVNPPVVHDVTIEEISSEDIIDIAIIGAGISGLYAAYRLSHAVPNSSPVLQNLLNQSKQEKLDIEIFDENSRVGGRIWTITLPEFGDLKVEMGAMRFVGGHENVFGLAQQELALPIENADFMGHRYFDYLRGKQIPFSAYSDNPAAIPYQLAPDEQGKTPGELYVYAVHQVVPTLKTAEDRFAMLRALRNASYPNAEGVQIPLYQWRTQDLLRSVLSEEGFQLLYDAFGFESLLDDGNAYDTFVAFYQGNYVAGAYYRFVDGYQALPNALADRFIENGGLVHLNHRLIALNEIQNSDGETLIALQLEVLNDHKNIVETRYARKVILTISKEAIFSLAQDSMLFAEPEIVEILRSVTAYPASKLFFVYREPWWEALGLTKGVVHTDLPLGALYYFDANDQGALLLASYRDGIKSTWSPLDINDPEAIIQHAQQQLQDIHGIETIPLPEKVLYADWMPLPFGGAWYLWQPGVRSWELMSTVRRPYENSALFIASSSYAESSGWVESVINNTEKLLETEFAMVRPAWLEEDYYLAP